MPRLVPIEATDAPLREALLSASLPVADLTEPGRTFFRLDGDGETIGFGGYELYGPDMLLRSVVVVPAHRGHGHGETLTELVLSAGARAGARDAYLMTASAEVFFERHGFRRIPRHEAPASILATRQATTICSSAAMLTRRLDA